MHDSKKASGNPKINKGLQYAEKLVGIKWQYKAPSEDSCLFRPAESRDYGFPVVIRTGLSALSSIVSPSRTTGASCMSLSAEDAIHGRQQVQFPEVQTSRRVMNRDSGLLEDGHHGVGQRLPFVLPAITRLFDRFA